MTEESQLAQVERINQLARGLFYRLQKLNQGLRGNHFTEPEFDPAAPPGKSEKLRETEGFLSRCDVQADMLEDFLEADATNGPLTGAKE